jgi:pimeloyl-ACP methyl ester carboxylesterase
MNEVEVVQRQVGAFSTRCLLAGPSSADVVLLLHDGAWGGASSVSWTNVIPLLASRFRVVAPDMLGFGGTDKAVFLDRSPYEFRIRHLCELLESLGIFDPVHVVGSSFGGSIALRMVEACPERLASAVSISGTGGPWRTEFGRTALGTWDGSRKDLERIVDLIVVRNERFDFNAHIEERLKWAVTPGHYRAMIAPTGVQPVALRQTGPVHDGWPESLASTSIPVLLIAGSQDPLVDPGWTGNLSAHIPSSEVVLLDAKHSPNIDDPEGTADLLTNWIDRNSTYAQSAHVTIKK